MADIELVIKLPEALYNNIQNGCSIYPYTLVYEALKNGTPLPKGHGRLGDLDALAGKGGITKDFLRLFAPTIIGADIESEAKKL